MKNEKIMATSPEIQELYRLAREAREKSYSPYSRQKVGAAIRLATGACYDGCNVENSSFGATVCAERVAIQKAVSELGSIQITEVMVVTDASPAWPPCGVCRQVIAEFNQDAIVHFANLKGEVTTMPFRELMPQAFTPANLKSASK